MICNYVKRYAELICNGLEVRIKSLTITILKSMLTMKIMEEKMYTGLFDRLMLLRNPVAVDNFQLGILPGDQHSKIGFYFNPMLQYLTNNSMFSMQDAFDPSNEECSKRRGYQLDMEPIQHLKGVSVDRTIMVLDEAEDTSL